jgi:protein SCO1
MFTLSLETNEPCWALRPRALRAAAGLIASVCCIVAFGASGNPAAWRASLDVSGNAMPLEFTMTRAIDGKQVSEDDYRGRVILLYFGYVNCPDVCPTTLTHVAAVLKQLGADAEHVRMLFVAVDPDRDLLPILQQYVERFSPDIDGLRGTPDQLAALAGRYHAGYSAKATANDYQVMHSAVIYAFDAKGAARLLIPSLGNAKPDIAGVAADLRRVIDEKN